MFRGLVGFLALLGAVALALRFFRAAGGAVLWAAAMAAASGSAAAGARRGDLTAMSEARAAERSARTYRLRSLGAAGAFLLWLLAPLALGSAAEVYAIAAPLWLLPGERRPGRPEPAPESAGSS
jgi:hypothetical protein